MASLQISRIPTVQTLTLVLSLGQQHVKLLSWKLMPFLWMCQVSCRSSRPEVTREGLWKFGPTYRQIHETMKALSTYLPHFWLPAGRLPGECNPEGLDDIHRTGPKVAMAGSPTQIMQSMKGQWDTVQLPAIKSQFPSLKIFQAFLDENLQGNWL